MEDALSDEKYKRKRPFRLQLRFDEYEYNRLESDSEKIGKSKGLLLREVYFNKLPKDPVMTSVDIKKVVAELKRIGNNINQLAYKANIGEIVLDKNFVAVREELHQILMFLRRTSGVS